MLRQVPIAAVVNTLKLFPSKRVRKTILDINRRFSVVRQLVAGVFVKAEVFFFYTEVNVPLHAGLFPKLEPLFMFGFMDEKLHFHLFEFSHAERKVSRS